MRIDWWKWIDENALAWKFGSIYPGFPVKIKENPRDEGVGLIEFFFFDAPCHNHFNVKILAAFTPGSLSGLRSDRAGWRSWIDRVFNALSKSLWRENFGSIYPGFSVKIKDSRAGWRSWIDENGWMRMDWWEWVDEKRIDENGLLRMDWMRMDFWFEYQCTVS